MTLIEATLLFCIWATLSLAATIPCWESEKDVQYFIVTADKEYIPTMSSTNSAFYLELAKRLWDTSRAKIMIVQSVKKPIVSFCQDFDMDNRRYENLFKKLVSQSFLRVYGSRFTISSQILESTRFR